MSRRTAILVGTVAVLAAAFVLLLATRSPSDAGPAGSAAVGGLAPALTGTTLDGEPFDLDDLRGEWVVVNFFATWCPPCVTEHPELIRFAEANEGRAEVVSVAFDDTDERVGEFFAANGGDWPVLTGDTQSASLDYGVVKLPESYVIDPNGTVVAKLDGGVTADELQAVVDGRTS